MQPLKPFPKRPIGCKLSSKIWIKIEQLFRAMDADGSNAVTRVEAKMFFKGSFANLSVEAMFNEVDTDGSGAISANEFASFWIQVRKAGYSDEDILCELDELIEGGTWVDWKDGRNVNLPKHQQFPKRPILCRISQKCWNRCEDLFRKMDPGGSMMITREAAEFFFQGAFRKISANAMFNEVDLNQHGVITPREFMLFWVQVKASGYKEQEILDELDNLLSGSPWVDWKDGRQT